MVKPFFLSLILVTAAGADDFGFRTECLKPEVFQGETVACSFVLASSDEIVEVEVAKFPEFRGFWSENIALRQGPIPLLSVPYGDGARKGVVGTYSLIPMLGRTDSQILPMKIVVRHPMSAIHADLIVESEPTPLKIKPLPPIPPELANQKFFGAVGTFTLELETKEVLFQKDEPTQVKITLNGEGNFPELNALEIPFPSDVEVLSKKVYSSGPGQFGSQTFETTVASHTEKDFVIPAQTFLYFDPQRAKYEPLLLPEIAFRNTPAVAKMAADEREPIAWRPPEESPSVHVPWSERRPFWIAHVLGLLIVTGILLLKSLRAWGEKRRQSPAFQRALRMEIAQQAIQNGNLEMFLRLADSLAYEVLCEKAAVKTPCTRRELLALSESRVAAELVAASRSIFDAHNDFLYSPEKKHPTQTEALREALQTLTPTAKKRRAA